MVSGEEVRRVARLAKLELAAGEEERLAAQLSSILDYVELLRGIDAEELPADAAPHAAPAAERADEPRRGIPHDVVLALAPAADPPSGTFLVPPPIDAGGEA